MPRIRTLKPEHRQHRKVGPLDHVTYRLWVGMICEADDAGRLAYDPEALRVLIFGYHPEVTAACVEASAIGLEARGLIVRYEVENQPYAAFPSWADHQRINRPTPSKLPSPNGSQPIHGAFSEHSVSPHGGFSEFGPPFSPNPAPPNIHGGLTEDSLSAHGGLTPDRKGSERIGKERKGSERIGGEGSVEGRGLPMVPEPSPTDNLFLSLLFSIKTDHPELSHPDAERQALAEVQRRYARETPP